MASAALEYIVPQLRMLAVSIGSVVEDPKNARVHGDRNLETIKASIRSKGQDQPIVVRKSDRMISKGHGRLAAMKSLGYSHIAAVVIDESRISAIERGIVDNRASDLAENDDLALAALFKELGEEEGEIIGWSEDEVAGMLTELEARLSSEPDSADQPTEPTGLAPGADVIPPPPRKVTTKRGQTIKLGPHTLFCGDCMDLLATLPDNSVDSMATDPPYGLSPDGRARTWDDVAKLREEGKGGARKGVLDKAWDAAVPGVTWARECLRVLKPGGFLLAASHPRTYHRLAGAVEDGGFEIRDLIPWIYWDGFAKNLNVAAAIDKQKHNRVDVLKVTAWVKAKRRAAGLKNKDIDDAFGMNGMAGHWTSSKSQPSVPTLAQFPHLLRVLGVEDPGEKISTLLFDLNAEKGRPGPNWWKREVTGQYAETSAGQMWSANAGERGEAKIVSARRDNASTEEAKAWEGWGTALSPTHEPFCFARKPLEGTVAQNIAKWGVGAINIDACRIPADDDAWPGPSHRLEHPGGRHPPNIYRATKPSTGEKREGLEATQDTHPTIKPAKMIRWMLELITPAGGTVLEPFAGSGTAFVAARGLDLTIIAAELDPAYCDLSRARYKGGS